MFEQKQYDAWAVQLANYFVSKFEYQMVRMAKNQKEFWLVNNENETSPIVMISAMPSDQFDQAALSHDRLALSSVFHVSPKGLNISVHQESIFSDDYTVIVGPGMVSVSSILAHFGTVKSVLSVSSNPEKSLAQSFRSIQRNAARIQKKVRRKAFPITTIISGICIAVFGASLYLSYRGFSLTVVAVMLGAFYKPMIVQGMEFFRFLSAGFLHVDLIHLMMNLLAFRNIGMMIEPVLGKYRYLTVLLLGIVYGNVFVFIVDGGVVGLGLSGGLFALLGVLLVYLFETQAIRNPRIRSQVISTLFINLLISFMPGVSMMAHIGGLQIGIFMGLIFSKRKDWQEIRTGAKIMLSVFSVFLGLLMFKNAYAEVDPVLIKHLAYSWNELGWGAYAERLFKIFIIGG